jgi:hypothetical protein
MNMTRIIIQSNIDFSRAPAASNEITDNNSHRAKTHAPLLPRVVTPMSSQPSPPRVPRRSRNLAPHNLSQEDFCGVETAHMIIALGNHHWSHAYQANAVDHPITGKEMEYMALMKDPRLQPLWKRGFGNECGRLFQGIRDITGTESFF